jgi:filamentous hemagglutinin
MVRITQQAQLTSMEAAVNAATKNGVKFDEIIRIGGWELKFGRPRNPGDLPTLFHALPLE